MRLPSMKAIAALGLALAAVAASGPASAETDDKGPKLPLPEALAMVEDYSPLVKAAVARKYGAQEALRAAESGYYPLIGVDAKDSFGMPQYSTGMDGISGMIGSPYRSGPEADAFGTWDLVDATVWHAASAASLRAHASFEAERVQRDRVAVDGLRVYLLAVLYRGQQRAWSDLVRALSGVRGTVATFVRNGQYNEDELMLIQDQYDDAVIRSEDYRHEYLLAMQRLGLLTGGRSLGYRCPGPWGLSESTLTDALSGGGESPLVLQAADEAKAAHEVAEQYSAENLPKVELGGAAGWLNGQDLQQGQDYTAFAGVTMPLFEGFRIVADTRAAEREQEARDALRAEAQLELDDFDARQDEEIGEARADLALLMPEERRAAKAVTIARYRYLHFLGPLADLQQALKDSVTAESMVAMTKTKLLLALGSKAFVNGATLVRR